MKVVPVDSAVLAVPTPKPMFEYMDWMPPDLFEDVPRPDPADGLVRIPDRPGHGMALVPGAERKYRLR